MTPASRTNQSTFSLPISVLGLSFVLLLACSEAAANQPGGRWGACEVSLRLGVGGWERTTNAVLFARWLDCLADAREGREFATAAGALVPSIAGRDETASRFLDVMTRSGLCNIPPPNAA